MEPISQFDLFCRLTSIRDEYEGYDTKLEEREAEENQEINI